MSRLRLTYEFDTAQAGAAQAALIKLGGTAIEVGLVEDVHAYAKNVKHVKSKKFLWNGKHPQGKKRKKKRAKVVALKRKNRVSSAVVRKFFTKMFPKPGTERHGAALKAKAVARNINGTSLLSNMISRGHLELVKPGIYMRIK